MSPPGTGPAETLEQDDQAAAEQAASSYKVEPVSPLELSGDALVEYQVRFLGYPISRLINTRIHGMDDFDESYGHLEPLSMVSSNGSHNWQRPARCVRMVSEHSWETTMGHINQYGRLSLKLNLEYYNILDSDSFDLLFPEPAT